MSQAQVLPAEHFSPSVSLIEGRPATTSLAIANHFGKRHDHVMRSIKELMDNCPKEFTAPNFGVSEYMDDTGRTLPMFTVYFDGFILLVMGYTGKKALAMKLAYIAAFNAMREQLSAPASLPSQSTPSTADDRKPLRALVHAWAQVAGVHHAALWPQVKAHFQLSRIDDLPVEWIPDALAFVQGKIDELGKAKALPASTKRLPIYRDGCYYLPHVNKRHVPGPQEAALAALWKAWPYREAELKRTFAALGREIDDACASLFHHAISDLGRNADTMFSPDAMLEGFFLAQSTARPLFDEALHRVRTHLRMSLNVAVMLGR